MLFLSTKSNITG